MTFSRCSLATSRARAVPGLAVRIPPPSACGGRAGGVRGRAAAGNGARRAKRPTLELASGQHGLLDILCLSGQHSLPCDSLPNSPGLRMGRSLSRRPWQIAKTPCLQRKRRALLRHVVMAVVVAGLDATKPVRLNLRAHVT